MSNHISLPRLLFPSNSNSRHHLVLPLFLLTLLPLSLALSQKGTALSAHPLINQYPSMAIIMVVLLTSCFLTGFFSVYVHQCANRHGRRHSSPSVVPFAFNRRSLGIAGRGLDPSLIESFPTFLYSSVKGHKINKAVLLECAVCLNEFEDEETLQLIPKCCHAFHPECIGSWLSSHATCPVCRADLTPKAGEVIIHIPMIGNRCAEDPKSTEVESFRVSTVDQEARVVAPRRLRSTGHRMRLGRVFNYLQQSRSMGHSAVRAGEECERFTMRLPEEVMRNHEMMRRTKSCVAFPRESSHRSGYKTISNRWTLAVFSGRFSSDRSRRGSKWDEESGETWSDRLRLHPKGTVNGILEFEFESYRFSFFMFL